MATAWLVVGLGNPGPAYARTRHNVGFMTLDNMARRAGARWSKARGARAEVAKITLADAEVTLAKPATFMNLSGDAVAALSRIRRVGPDHIIVVHDEIDLELGQLRVKFGGGDNGHNGLRSIRARLGTGDFYRVRIGVSRPAGDRDPIDWVLGSFGASQFEDAKQEIAAAGDAVEALIRDGLAPTQNRFNN